MAAADKITPEAIEVAAVRIGARVRQTPVIEVDGGELGLGPFRLTLKLEFMQHSGSFKARGAFASLTEGDVPAAGVVAASGGNHGAAVACAARALGVPARIYVPSIASPAKIARIRGYGADLVVGGDSYADALAASETWVATTGARAIHAYDQPATVLGQGTVARELEAQAPGLDSVLVAVGGGGLVAGVAGWYGGRVRVIGVEPEGAPTLNAARAAGRPVDVGVSGLAADSLGARRIGSIAFAVTQRHLAASVLVPDAAIREAQALLWDRLRIVAEPGGAAALAAIVAGAYAPAAGERVGVLVCGGNTSAVDFSRHG